MELTDDSFYNDLKNLDEVADVEILGEPMLLYEPNDYLEGNGQPNRALELVHAAEAFDITHGDPNIYIGITDTNIETTHDELINKIVQNFDYSSSSSFHGTVVAGYAAADTDNGIGVSSIGFNTRLIFSDRWANTNEMLQLSQIPGVKVLNASWLNNCVPSSTEQLVYDEIWNSGVVTVCAAGNNANHCSSLDADVYPASYNHTISVSSVGCSFPYGTTHQWEQTEYETGWEDSHVDGGVFDGTNSHHHNEHVDLVAPGYGVPGGITQNNGYTKAWGTSFASPQVAAACALIFSVNPNLSSDEVRDILLSTTDDIYHLPINQQFIGKLGTGRLNVYRAVKTAKCLLDNNSNAQLDLYIRDSNKDLAVEPDVETCNIMWNSKDIWVRNQADGKCVRKHQNPEYDPNNANYVYVRVRNTSCVTSSGNDQLKLYWAKANTALNWPNNWDGSLLINDPVTNNDILMGNEVATLNIPILKPGQETILEYEWQVPNPNDYANINSNIWHFCLLSRIVSTDDPMSFPETSNLYANVKNNNNIAWRNTTVVDVVPNQTTTYGGTIAVANPFNTVKTFKLELIKEQNEDGKAIYNEAEVGLKMDDILLNAWKKGGENMVNLKTTNNEKKKVVKDNNVLIDNIQFDPNELGTLYISFNFLTKELTDKDHFTYHVIQRDAVTNEIVGGETFEIQKKKKTIFIANAGNDKEIEKNEAVQISANEIINAKEYNWYDEDGNLIYTGKDLTVSPDVTKKYKLEVIDQDGFKDYDEIEIKVNPFSLQSLSPNPASNQVTVEYKTEGSSSAYLMITSATNGTSNNYILNTSDFQMSIDVSSYPQGVYGVTLICDGVIVATKNLIIQ